MRAPRGPKMSSRLRRVLERKHARRKRMHVRVRNKRRVRARRRGGGDEKIRRFREWCGANGIALHPDLYVGRTGSCADIGVVATADIPEGTVLAQIPRNVLLTAANSRVMAAMKTNRAFRRQLKTMNSWVPLLLALLIEYGEEGAGFWGPYLSLVPSKKSAGPSLQWPLSVRERLLGGTGVLERVERDKANITRDYHNIVLPFMKCHPELFKNIPHSQQLYEQLVCFVMAYSFSDTGQSDVCAETMMVPFVDILNHHSHHHAELIFLSDTLELVAVRNINQGAEVMNTYGPLSNASLLHVYGFTEKGNPHDVALIHKTSIINAYGNFSVDGSHDLSHDQRWERLKQEDVMEEEFEVDSSGHPEPSLIAVVKLLLVSEKMYDDARHTVMDEEGDMRLESLLELERQFMHQLCGECLARLQRTATHSQAHDTTACESFALQLVLGQQRCLTNLEKRLTK